MATKAKTQATPPSSAAGGAPARAAGPATSRVRTAKHSKAVPQEIPVAQAAVSVAPPVEEPTISEVVTIIADENPHEAIAKIAYCYWMDRGCQGGHPDEDWVRAEQQYWASAK